MVIAINNGPDYSGEWVCEACYSTFEWEYRHVGKRINAEGYDDGRKLIITFRCPKCGVVQQEAKIVPSHKMH